MALSTSSEGGREASPLLSLAVYCPLLCEDREERAADNILFFHPGDTHLNTQMNHVGFCIAISSLAPRFGVSQSQRQTIRKQRSSVCVMSPVQDVWLSAHVRGGNSNAVATHHLLHLSCVLFELLYGPNSLRQLSQPLQRWEGGVVCGDARAALRSFFARCASFIGHVLAAQRTTRESDAAPDGAGPSPASPVTAAAAVRMSPQEWAQHLRSEAPFGLPVHFVSSHELPPLQLGRVEEVLPRVLGQRGAHHVADDAAERESAPAMQRCGEVQCCVFLLPSLHVLVADCQLPRGVVQAMKYYLLLYSPLACTSFRCHLPPQDGNNANGDDGLCEAAVWIDGDVLVVVTEPCTDMRRSVGEGTASAPSLMEGARRLAAEVRLLLSRPAAGATTPESKDAYWLSTADVAQHGRHYKVSTASVGSGAAAHGLVVHWCLRGAAVVAGTPLRQVAPSFAAYVREVVYATQVCRSSSPATCVVECWVRWRALWVYLRFAGASVTVLAWQQQPNVSPHQLIRDVPRLLLLAP